MDNNTELQITYAGAVSLMGKYIGRPPPQAFLNPSGWVTEWARTHPNEAYNLASDLYQLLHRYFSTRV